MQCLPLVILVSLDETVKIHFIYIVVEFKHKIRYTLKHLDNKWAVRLLSDSLKNCYFDFRGWVTLPYPAGFHIKQTHATSEVPFCYILLVV